MMNVYFENRVVARADDIAKVLENPEISKLGEVKMVVAAGGLVRNARGEALMIMRRGLWDLPKGHVDPDESIADCALREVREECGVLDLRLGRPLCTTLHIYDRGGWTLKQTHWFAMSSAQHELTPQSAEGIERAEWISPADTEAHLSAAFAMIREVFAAE
jgi:8-oxo-dGTP pyrophosphatase MutT (NUDIX family)